MPVTAVLDIGKTNVKLVVFDAAGEVLWERSKPNHALPGAPYPHADVDAIFDFILAALRDAAATCAIDTIVPTSHGATGALVDETGLVLPVMDYEFEGVEEIEADYANIRPPFFKTFSPPVPNGLNLGRQLAYQAWRHTDDFARAKHFLAYPQYWSWRLSGVAASEVTSLGCHTDLWSPRENRPSSLVEALGLSSRLPPLKPAWATLGALKPEIARATLLPTTTRVLSGVHDSNASIIPFLPQWEKPFTVVSTGTWIVLLGVGLPLDALDPKADMLANVDIEGRPTACAKYMGGREYAEIAGGELKAPARATIEALIARGVFALPAFSPNGGPYVGRPGHILGDVAQEERGALATLYAALMTDDLLTRLRAKGAAIVDGNLGANEAYCALLAELRDGQQVASTLHSAGAAAGAALLATWPKPSPAPQTLAHESFGLAGLFDYRDRWKALIAKG